jgi:hypothetical protein
VGLGSRGGAGSWQFIVVWESGPGLISSKLGSVTLLARTWKGPAVCRRPFPLVDLYDSCVNLFSPAAMVGFFEELAEAEARGTPTPELLGEISERNHMGIVGPVPDTYL